MKCTIMIFIFIALPVFGSVHETLPSWHWAYDYIECLQIAGFFQDVYQMNRPLTRGDAAKSILETGYQIKQNQIELSRSDLKRYKCLASEFSEEIRSIQGRLDSVDVLELGGHLIEDVVQHSDENVKFRGVYRSRIHVPVGRNIALYNGISFDQYLVDDPDYTGKEWRGITGYTEQAYVNARFGRFRVRFGRDFLKWGPGQSGTLIFSDIARPLDHFSGSLDVGPFRFSYCLSRLDDWKLSAALQDSLGGSRARRYISCHRLDARFFKGRLQCAVTEAVTYGGVNRSPEWTYLNPFVFYHGAQLNESGKTNTFGSIDILGYPAQRWQVYGSLMIDDIQIEKTGPGDLEPNETGFLTGTQWSPIAGTTVSAEYVRITNRTYKTPNSWETFVHRGVPLGHPQGNDFDLWQAGWTQWIGSKFRGEITYGQVRKGEGDLFTPFDTPWMNYTVKQGYSEPFPTGVVEKQSRFHLKMNYYASAHWGLKAEFQSIEYQNYQHIKDENENKLFWKLGVWVDGGTVFHMK
ncbi:hypothetical protein JW835_14605 [bacterium]|nr:hypothetical protein [bacterium]